MMMKRTLLAILALLLLNGTVLAEEVVLKWTGCGITKKAFMAEAAKAYETKTGVKIALSGGGATKGIRFANAGAADLGGCCRPALPATFAAKEGETHVTVVGWDAIVPIINPQNPVTDISTDQLKAVYTGQITNWSELGGPDQPLVLVVRKGGEYSGVGYMARKILFGGEALPAPAGAMQVKSSGPLEKKVEAHPWAFGITGISSAKKRNVKIMSIDGAEATAAKIARGDYPTFRPLYLATKGVPSGETGKFISWLLSEEGQDVVEKSGTVSLRMGVGLKEKFQYWDDTSRVTNFDELS
jgi:phosphate transport system substrate-binding protein